MSKFPSDDTYLPTDLEGDIRSLPCNDVLLGTHHSTGVSSFGRQCQAVSMLNESIQLLKFPNESSDLTQATKKLNQRLHDFLQLIMQEYEAPGKQCGPNAIVIRCVDGHNGDRSRPTQWFICSHLLTRTRALFLVNQGMLTKLHGVESATLALDNARATLNSNSNMMGEIAAHHAAYVANIEILPAYASYNAWIAIDHIYRHQDQSDQSVRSMLEALTKFASAFDQRWPRLAI
jgi:hypothetical protein